MNVGTKSLLFGVHQFLWHPYTVYRAWVELYKTRPTWRETACIIIHDWGYWGSPNMDGEEGTRHPELGATIAGGFFGTDYEDLVLLHSRHYVKEANERIRYADKAFHLLEDIDPATVEVQPSKLCWADKLSILYDPKWWYLLRARLSGEIKEYRQNAARAGLIPLTASDSEWFDWIREKFVKLAKEMDPTVVPYMPNGKPKSKGA